MAGRSLAESVLIMLREELQGNKHPLREASQFGHIPLRQPR